MTGPTGRILQYITRETGPIEVLEAREDGKIVAIIDEFNIVREMRRGNSLVYVDLLNYNRTNNLNPQLIHRYGLRFNERLPPRIPPNRYQ